MVDGSTVNNNTQDMNLSQFMNDSKFEPSVYKIDEGTTANLSPLMDDSGFEFNIDSIPTRRSRQCYYCEKVFNRIDNCMYHQKHCRKREYPNALSTSKRRKTIQIGHGSQNTPQLISSALDGT